MGIFTQPKVPPNPPTRTLHNKTALVTGATAGLGLETARQLLTSYGISTLILAVRNTTKGQAIATALLSSPAVQAANPTASIKVLHLDLESYASVASFAAEVRATTAELHLLVLNAGLGNFAFARSADTGHEVMLQVNYLSNALLLLSLLPLLEAATARTPSSPARVTWVGSRMKNATRLGRPNPGPGVSVLAYLDAEKNFSVRQYGETKFACALFMREFAARVGKERVVLNMLCPGMVRTDLERNAPIWLRGVVGFVKGIRGRSVDEGAWIILHAAAVAGVDSHGVFFGDRVVEGSDVFEETDVGKDLGRRLWKETLEEVGRYTTLAEELKT